MKLMATGIRFLVPALFAVAAFGFSNAYADPPATAQADLPQVPVVDRCLFSDSGLPVYGYQITVWPEIIRQGTTLKVVVTGATPMGFDGVPNSCLEGWALSEPNLGKFTDDHTKLVLADGARVGASVRIAAKRGDSKVLSRPFKILARDAVVLTGYWHQLGDERCPVSEPPLKELHLGADGRFEATWDPFEHYVDFWGDYTFDPVTNKIGFSPTGGNYLPEDVTLTGKATLEPEGRLRLDGVFFGTPYGKKPLSKTPKCTLMFH